MKAMSIFCLLQELSLITNRCRLHKWSEMLQLHCGVKMKTSALHYDTTTRNTNDGEWPAIIPYFSKGDEYVLRPLLFAYEDRNQIEELLVETYSRLSVAASVDKQENITPAALWEKTDAIMTDSVSKNLKIEDLIGESLGSDHWPYHLLCKSHTVEKLDATNLKVLATIEKPVNKESYSNRSTHL